MSTLPVSGSSSSSGALGVPINITGLGSGLDTNAIISALMGVERLPVTRMSNEQAKLQAQQQQLQSIQSSLQSLAFAAAEFSLPSLFETSQTVTSSEPTRVSATSSAGAGPGGHEVSVTQLANSAQRTFAFVSPTSEDTITIDGKEIAVKAGASAQELASTINSNSEATVYAAVLDSGTLVLSNRATGNTGSEFIKVSDPGGTLTEAAGTAKEGKNAEYAIDGVAATSASNTVTNAIAGVSLSLNGLTSTGPVTINVAPPAPSASAIQAQVQSFVNLYNSTIGSIQKQLTTKPPTSPSSAELGTGSLFGDTELSSLLNRFRQSMYEPITELPTGMSSLADIGVTTGGPSGGGTSSQASIEGQLTINSTTLANAIQANPAGVEKMLQSWSQSFQGVVNTEAQPGGAIEARISGDTAQITQLGRQMDTLNELLDERQKALQATYAKLEGVISQNQSQASWLASQTTSLNASGI
jgi:flagellar hook-associated protein 2